jgi:hypothetical protein
MLLLSTPLRFLLSSWLLLAPMLVRAQASVVPWAWAARATGLANSTAGRSVAVDGTGNVYVTGYFAQTLTLGTTTLTTDSTAAFLAKYTPQGNVLWLRQLGSSGQGVGYQVVADATGNCYVAGVFRGTLQAGATTLVSQSDGDEFLLKYTAQGTPEWALRYSDLAPRYRDPILPAPYFPLSPYLNMHLALDAQGNLYTASRFRGTITRGAMQLTAPGPAYSSDALVVKYTPQGQVQWARQGGGTSSDYAADVAVDATGNVYVVGGYETTATFGNLVFPSSSSATSGSYNVYLLKYDAQGNSLWGRPIQAPSGREYALMKSVGVDANGNAYVLGDFLPQITLGPTTFSLPTASSAHVFLAKYDPQGTAVWARMAGSAPPNTIFVSNGYDLAVQADGTTTLTGSYTTTMTFETLTLGTSGGYNQIFMARYSAQGGLQWAVRAGGGVKAPTFSGNQNGGFGVATDAAGATYFTGQYGGQADFGPLLLDSTATPLPTLYVAKIAAAPLLGTAASPRPLPACTLAPNPASGPFVSLLLAQPTQNVAQLRLVNAVGQVVYHQRLPAGTRGYEIPVTGRSAGLYHVQVISDKKLVSTRATNPGWCENKAGQPGFVAS